MRIVVVGSGYVGLVAGTGFAEFGNTVACIDSDRGKIDALLEGRIPIYEPGLEELVRRNVAEERLSFGTDLTAAIEDAEMVFIAVGTPPKEDGSADLKHVLAVAESLADALRRDTVVVLKSTVPVGTNDQVHALFVERAKVKVSVVSNPEFLKEGDAINDFLKPDRVLLGVRDEAGRAAMRRLYAPLQLNHDRLLFVDPRSAEMAKYVANAMLATRISFMNDIARLCEAVGADVGAVRKGVGSDQRIGSKFLFPGAGYGGSCFPKDVSALLHLAERHDIDLSVVRATEAINARQKAVLFEKLSRQVGSLKDLRIAVWGLAFKPRTDDVREAPALQLIEQLIEAGAEVRVHDPAARATARAALGELAHRVIFVEHPYDATVGADALVLVTEWQEYRSPDFQRLSAQMRRKLLIDGRNVWSALEPEALGFTYEGIGLGRR
ncbi:MAG: UDP-glucose/GDP-mannose dehydrogenase family protein [Deltaproteobacteria bacterium]|jgi:UDPglucose 6-dehydrogenase|nr:UDP-glucose/GDP-mannose dehydrogenase family protein [Deltaproteobacteria bacterium]MBP6831300.1 UDP-glucose/GDP-mannose dehydrogenase family protein [Deltaproteobacteria bacterium]